MAVAKIKRTLPELLKHMKDLVKDFNDDFKLSNDDEEKGDLIHSTKQNIMNDLLELVNHSYSQFNMDQQLDQLEEDVNAEIKEGFEFLKELSFDVPMDAESLFTTFESEEQARGFITEVGMQLLFDVGEQFGEFVAEGFEDAFEGSDDYDEDDDDYDEDFDEGNFLDENGRLDQEKIKNVIMEEFDIDEDDFEVELGNEFDDEGNFGFEGEGSGEKLEPSTINLFSLADVNNPNKLKTTSKVIDLQDENMLKDLKESLSKEALESLVTTLEKHLIEIKQLLVDENDDQPAKLS